MQEVQFSDLSNEQLVAIYNDNSSKPVKRFERRPVAEARVRAVLADAGLTLEAACIAIGIIEGSGDTISAEDDGPSRETLDTVNGVLHDNAPGTLAEDDEASASLVDEETADDLRDYRAAMDEQDERDAEAADADDDEQSIAAIMRRNAERLGLAGPLAEDLHDHRDAMTEQDERDAEAAEGDVLIEGDTASTAERVEHDQQEQPQEPANDEQPTQDEAEDSLAGAQDESEGEEAQFVFSLPCTPAAAHKLAAMLAKATATPVKYGNCECSAIGAGRIIEPPRRAPARTSAARHAVGPRNSRPRAGARDWSVKPTITSASNQHVQKLIDRIDAARGDADALRALDGFSRTSTYYKMAGNFLDALLAEAAARAA